MRTLGGQQAEVLAMLDEAERLDPECTDVHLQRGLLYFNLDQPDKALADIERGLTRSPGDDALLFARGTVLRFLGQGAEASAGALGDRAPRHGLGPPPAHGDRDLPDDERLGRSTRSTTFELAKKKNPTWPQSRFGLALANFRLRRFDKSAEVAARPSSTSIPGTRSARRCWSPWTSCARTRRWRREGEGPRGRRRTRTSPFCRRSPRARLSPRRSRPSVATLHKDEDGQASLEHGARARRRAPEEGLGGQSLRISGGIVYELLAQLALPLDAARARKYAQEALTIRPRTDGARIVLADLDARDGKIGEALKRVPSVLRDFPQAPLAAARILEMRLKDSQAVSDAERDQAGR